MLVKTERKNQEERTFLPVSGRDGRAKKLGTRFDALQQ
jgi:hypothetical protein